MDRFRFACEEGVIGAAREDCRGFVGALHLVPRVRADGAAGVPSRTSLWHGNAAVALSSASHERILLVTGGCRHGAGLAQARRVVDGAEPPASLTELPGGLGCAFVLLDVAEGRVVLGRDRTGIMPLYLCRQDGRFAFATELGALAALADGQPEPDAEVLAMYFDHGFGGDHRAPLAGVEKVLPGEVIQIDRHLEITRRRAPRIAIEKRHHGRPADVAAHFDGVFDAAVSAHVDPDRPASLLLSGGLDSALVCASLTRVVRAPVRTYTVAYDFTRKREESTEALRIASLYRTEHTELRLTQTDLWRHIPWTVWRTDDLMDDHAALATSLAAGHLGPDTTVFTGEGADDVFAGDGQYRRHALQHWCAGLASPGSGGWRTRGLWPRSRQNRIFGPRLREASRAGRSDVLAAWADSSARSSWLQRVQCCELASVFPNTLAIKVGRSFEGAAHAVHMPFLDPEVIRFGLGLDDRMKVRGRVGKFFLRDWACRRLPRDYVFRPKRGFYTPISQLLSGERLDHLEPVLCSSQFVARWFDTTEVASLFAAHRATGRHGKALWRLLQAAIWYSIFVLRPGSRPTRSEDPLVWIF